MQNNCMCIQSHKIWLYCLCVSCIKRKSKMNPEVLLPGANMIFYFLVVSALWLLTAFVEIIFIPIHIYRLFLSPKKCPPIDNDLLLLSAGELAERIRKREIACETVIRVYIARIEEVNPVINAVIAERFDAAVDEARNTDRFLLNSVLSESELKFQYPLLGVPITIKGSLAIAGMNNTAGRPDHIVRAEIDGAAVKQARAAGAIPLLTSNVPELCLNWETTNKLIGTTRNPYNTTRTVGGSSGGETSLLASAASVIGIGSDIAGSLRLPAHFCGVWGHKPSPHLVSCDGHYPDCKNRKEWDEVFTVGPMARYAPDLRLLLSVIATPEYRKCVKLDEKVDVRSLKIYYVHDVKSPLAHKISDDVNDAVTKVIEFFDNICTTKCTKVNIPLMKHSAGISYVNLLQIDNVENLFDNSGKGCYMELLRFCACKSSHVLTSILYSVLRRNLNVISRENSDKCDRALQMLRDEFIGMLGDDGVFICPSFTRDAHYHGDAYRNVFDYGRQSIYNALGFPVTNCPIGMSKNGLPIGIQVVAAPNCDHLSLSVAEKLEEIFGGWTPPSINF